MKNITMVLFAFFTVNLMAGEYTPLNFEYDLFKGHRLHHLFEKAMKSNSQEEASVNWYRFLNKGRISGEPGELHDLTQYYLYRHAVLELIRLEYLMGNTHVGDELIDELNQIQITSTPSDSLLRLMCKRLKPKECF